MRSLFLKIFLWFWLATVLVVGVFVASHIPGGRKRPDPRAFLTQLGARAVESWERGGSASLCAYADELQQAMGVRIMLFDARGSELSGRFAPPGVNELMQRAADDGRLQEWKFDGASWVAVRVLGADQRGYVFASERPDPFERLAADPTAWLGRLAAVVTMAGIVCYALGRYLTAPIRQLRAATRELARGNLGARVSSRHRRDEIGDLGRDFNIMAERIDALLAAQRRLLRDISHELRSPLARLNVSLELARQSAGPGAESALDRIGRESDRLGDLIGHLLTLARHESGPVASESAEIDLAQLVREVATDADFEAASRGRRVRVVECPECKTRGTILALRSAIENVVRNAVRHTAEGTEVEVRLRLQTGADSGSAFVEVRDHGLGVPEAALRDIFQPFYRVSDARDRSSGGSGLGLAITDRAIRLHGGSVTAANASGGGLVVRIQLPCTSRA